MYFLKYVRNNFLNLQQRLEYKERDIFKLKTLPRKLVMNWPNFPTETSRREI